MLPNSSLIQSQLSRANGGVGLYQVRVKLDKPTITIYGEEQLFVPGMTLTADIELDTRHWISTYSNSDSDPNRSCPAMGDNQAFCEF